MSVLDLGLIVSALCVFLLIYPHCIYPLVLWVASKYCGKPYRQHEDYTPTLAILISAYNEQDGIAACLEAIFASDYPIDKMSVYVADDGSTDATVEVVEALCKEHAGLTMVRCQRAGKNAALNTLIQRVTAQVVMFMDADTVVSPSAFRHLVSPLADDTVGATISLNDKQHDVFQNDAGNAGDSFYRRLEDVVNLRESSIHSTVASNGGLYAVKSAFIQPINNSRAADDLLMILRVMRAGKRVLKQPLATIHEHRPNSLQVEGTRTARTVSAGLTTVWDQRMLLLPTFGWVSFFLWSHRIVRYGSPFWLILLFAATWCTVSDPMVFGILFYGQFAFYALGLLSRAAGKMGQTIPVASTVEYFIVMNIALLRGWFRFLTLQSSDQWTPGQT